MELISTYDKARDEAKVDEKEEERDDVRGRRVS
jgi:hypothetical protein